VSITVRGVDGIGEVRAGADLAAEIGRRIALADGDVVVITSKVVSKAEGRVARGERAELVDAHTVRVVARRGATRIARTSAGLTLAAAGLDASNTAPGTVVLLPLDADASARALRERLADLHGVTVAVVVTDTAGRAWRNGQTDIAIGVAGILPLVDLAGRPDSHGAPLAVTAPAVADEIAAAADLVQGKLSRTPVAVLSGLADQVLPADEHGPGAAALVRPAAEDLFGWGAADAVRVAVRRDDERGGDGFPAADGEAADLVDDALTALEPDRLEVRRVDSTTWAATPADGCDPVAAAWAGGALAERLRVLAASTHRRVQVQQGPHPYVLRWTLHPEPPEPSGGTRGGS
jgi:coenzyme F420-0:L-glutamate ligase/coenzyme F420-1:gamma-L-glutamate ligase